MYYICFLSDSRIIIIKLSTYLVLSLLSMVLNALPYINLLNPHDNLISLIGPYD